MMMAGRDKFEFIFVSRGLPLNPVGLALEDNQPIFLPLALFIYTHMFGSY